ncbi:hypothetical protein [Rheinheimera sp. MM224]|uniref:hypothetical protein n=1 Tax=Rheinheimera sp. MM224 TaxID=3019969 RepID=UPI0021F87441|nr:hypothetical protein [Rheinheimera sp. MM224]CAI3805420.1 hypothetical protein JAMGFMIE_03868 [Rheinheimera sp. MM224]
MTSITISKQEYEGIKDDLKSDLIEELEAEVEFAEFETDKKGLWETPAVDSKAVVKLSPTIQKYTGTKLDPTWIKCGGYDSVVEAVEHIMEQLELEFQSN